MQNGYRAWSRQPLPTMGDSTGGSVVANITSGTFLSLCEKKRLCCLKATKKWLLIKIKCIIECSYHTIQGNITTNTARIGYRQFMARYHSFFHRFGWTPLINSKWAIYTLEWREVKWVLLAQHNDEDRVCRPDLSKS